MRAVSLVPKARPRGHLAYLDGLRALAALYVLVCHAWYQVWLNGNRGYPAGASLYLTGWLLHGHFAVDLFIVLSGFCLMLPLTRGDGRVRGGALDFFRRRARRILPPYYAALGLSALLIATCVGQPTGTHWDISIPRTWRAFVSNALMLQDVWQRYSINHCFWSIAVEWKIYFLFPLLAFAFRRWGALLSSGTAVLVSILVSTMISRYAGFLTGLTPHYVGLFTLGMLGAVVAYRPDDVPQWLQHAVGGPLAILSALVLCFLCARWSFAVVWARTLWLDQLVGVGSVALLVAPARSPYSLVGRICSWRPLVFVGTFAYSLYLTHAPILQVVWLAVGRPLERGSPLLEFIALAAVSVPVCLAVAYGFFLMFERPFLSKSASRAHAAASDPNPTRVTLNPAPPAVATE